MKLNSKLTGGLAWAGLVVVLAVPAADLVMGGKGDSVNSAITPTQTAEAPKAMPKVKPATASKPTAVAGTADPVDTYVSTGKKLPSYISDAPAEVASTKPAVMPKLAVPGLPDATRSPVTTEVASLPVVNAGLEAPEPYPASKRPRPGINQPVAVKPVTTVDPVTTASAQEKPLIIDDNVVQQRDEAVARVLDEDVTIRSTRPRIVEQDQLEEWDSGSLADYLERRGMLTNERQSADNSQYDEDGFFLDEGPNNSRSEARVIRRVKPRNDFFFF